MKPQRVIVTGATGWIGRNLVNRLSEEKTTVMAIGRRAPDDPIFRNPDVEYLRADLGSIQPEALKTFQADACVHLAWYTEPGQYWNSPINEQCLKDSQNFLTSCAAAGVKKFFIAGTCAEYGPCREPIKETHPLNTGSDSRYVQSKLALYDWVQNQFPKIAPDLEWIWGRVFYPFGPGGPAGKLTDWLWRELSEGRTVELRYPDSVKDYIHVEDIADAIWILLNQKVSGPVNIGSGTGTSVRAIAEMMRDKIGVKAGIISESDPEWRSQNPDPMSYVVADLQRLAAFGFQPSRGLEREFIISEPYTL